MKKYYFGKISFKNLQLCELRQFLCIVFNMGSMVVAIQADQLLPQFLLEPFDTLPPQYRHIGHVHEEILFWKNIFLQICSFVNLDVFKMGSMVVPIRADQLLPQFLVEPFDTLTSQYRHIGYVHEEILFWKNIFLKICSFVNLDNFCALFSTWVPW